MIVFENDNCVFFDVDDTLVMWEESELFNEAIEVFDPYLHNTEILYINNQHIHLLKRLKSKGKQIVVWSHGGHKWAEAVVKALQLEDYVDMIMTKMEDFVDDLELNEWATKNIYLNKGLIHGS